LFKGLTEEQRILQHDNLTKLSEKFRKTGEFDKGANEYFGFDAEKAFKYNTNAKELEVLEKFKPTGKGNAEGGRVPLGAGKLAQTLIQQIIKKYKGKIDDKLLKQMLADKNPQRLAEVMATVDEGLIMQGKGMGPETIIQSIKAERAHWTPEGDDMASGGRVPLGGGGAAFKLFKEFIDRLFIKSSNEIRRGEGLFKGLTVEQKIKQHDNLTNLSEKFRKTGEFDKGANEYFGFDAEKAFKYNTNAQELEVLEKFKPKGTPHASGGLAYMLGE